MKVADRLRNYVRSGAQALLAEPSRPDPADAGAWRDAAALWQDLFGPFAPLIEGADVLELGCGDGRLLGAVLHSGGRSAIGLDRHAYWAGEGDAVAWRPDSMAKLELHTDLGRLASSDEKVVDLILARELDGFFPIDGLEERLALLYGLLRPGGEMIARLRCGGPEGGPDGPGYGFMTPTAWTALMLGAGFEIARLRRIWRGPEAQGRAAAWLPDASDDERLTSEIHLHLIRPWESWELDGLKVFGDQRRARKQT